jgi:nicotinamidase-related amidase
MASLTLDPTWTAMIVIDLTKGVLSLPSVPHPVQEVLANTVRLADAFRSVGSFVVLVKVNSVDGKDMLHPISDIGFPLPAECPKDWAELAPELSPQPLDHLITKHQWGGLLWHGPGPALAPQKDRDHRLVRHCYRFRGRHHGS